MRRSCLLPLIVLSALGTATGARAATAEVQYIEPEHYTDAERGREAEQVRDALTRQLQALAQTYLPADQTLHLSVLDIDLAGRRLPFSRWGNDVRVVNGHADWPHLRLRYSLQQGDQVLASGQADLADMNYLDHAAVQINRGKLSHEQPMLEAWFRDTLAKQVPAH